DLIERMRSAQTAILDEAWANRAQGLPIATKEEALVLASIVEKETGVAEERPLVAAVFINRLRKGMRLQSDPTIIYGITGGEPLGRGIRRSEIDRKTAYNTYQIDGLPPTPIANPGKAAIEAVLNPPSTTDFYFVADGTGGHVFAQTLAQHQKNVANWRKIEKARKAARRTTN
ncbi:MAG: endolytic transglycosylase MltG, partial [Pseudomonadota bacterium]